ncbi:MAG TPA: ABC transporter substrate-binding protein, partial [Methylomirabilota bacterium]|nr:ABC transporter substrate-binding protein [Methylomirabilota bacterium]
MTSILSVLALVTLLVTAGGSALAQPATASKDSLTIAQFVDPPNLDPYNTTAPYISVFAQICEPLIYWDSDASGNAVIKKLLATDYRWLDTTRLQFKLRPGVRFSNGEPFNAEAAKLSLELLFAAFNYSQWLKDLLKEVTVVDDSTVTVVLNQPAGYVVSVLAFGSFQVAPRDYRTRGKDAFNQSPVCTGPWTLREHKKDSHLTLAANPTYWGGTPRFKTITYRIIPDDAARVAALEAGEVDIAPNIPHSASARIERNGNLRLATIPSLRQFATFFDVANPKAKPLEDARVRLALNLAIDRAAICKQIFAGRCTPMDGQYLSKWHSGFNPGLKAYPYDPAQARKLLTDAGHTGGFEPDYTYTTGRYPLDKQSGEAMASYLRAV